MVDPGTLIVSCLAANTAVNLLYHLRAYVRQFAHWITRIGRISCFIPRNDNIQLFKNISFFIHKYVSAMMKKTMLCTFDNKTIKLLYPGESIKLLQINPTKFKAYTKKNDMKPPFLEIIAFGVTHSTIGYEMLYAAKYERQFSQFLQFISENTKKCA